MVSESEHRKIIKELLDDIKDKLRSNLLVEREKIIGFSSSEAACHMFALLLHKKGLVSPGFNVNHRYFSSEKSSRERFNFDLPRKDKILSLLVEQERYRNLICYGRDKAGKVVEETVDNLFKIKNAIEKEMGEVL